MPPSFIPSRASDAIARERDARVLWLLGQHPVTAAMLVRIGWFPNRKMALRRLARLVAKKRIRLVGTVSRSGGRPEHVYCRWRPKVDQLIHEVELTELCLRLHAGTILRGPHVTDTQVRPDAEVWINGRVYYLELDRGTMGYAQIEKRFRTYENCPQFVLWVCSTRQRREEFRRRAEKIRHTALFAVFADALANPHAAIWNDYSGTSVALPTQCSECETPVEPGQM